MATDPTPTIDQQVADRPGQTAPVPLPAALQPSTDQTPSEFSGWDKLFAKQGQEPAGWKNLVSETGHVPMLTPDGKQSGDVPLPRAKEARAAGFHLAVPMIAPNRTAGWVPYHRVTEALSSGFQHVNDGIAAAADELSSLTSVGLLPAFLKTPRGKEISEQWNQEIQRTVHDPETRLRALVGLVQPGTEFGEGVEGLEEALGAKPGTPKKLAETSQAPIPETTGVAEPKAPEKPIPAEAKVPRTLEAKATEPGKYEVPAKAETEEKGQVVPRPIYARYGEPIEPVQVPPERTAGEHDAAIKEGKAVPAGIQKGDPEIDLPNLVLFHDPATGSTLALPDSQVTPENVRAQLRTSRAAYLKAKPEESEIVQPGHPLHIPDEPTTETARQIAPSENENEDMISKQRKERQPALPSPYKVRVEYRDEEGTPKQTIEDIQAYTARDAIERAQKKFPDASEWGIQSVGDRPASTAYTVPTGKMLSFPNSAGLEGDERAARDARTMYHEIGHAMVGQKEGIVNKGIVRHTYPGLTGARAAILWDANASDIYQPGVRVGFGSRGNLVGSRVIKPERLPGVVRMHLSGIAADELRGIPRNTNNNFSLRESDSDGRLAYQDLRNAGVPHERAIEIMNQAVDDAKEYLTHPAVKSVIDENALVREPDLSKQYHMSAERLRSMHEEVQRRMANDKQRQGKLEFANVGGDNGGNRQGAGAIVAGAQSQSPSGIGQSVSAEGEVKPAENVPGLLDTLRGASKPLENPNPVKPTSEPTPGSGSAIKPADTPAEAVPPTNTLTHPKAKEYAASVLRISAKVGKDAAINSGRRIIANGSTAPGEHPELQQLTDWLNQWESTVTSKELNDRITGMKDNPLKVIGSGESNALPAPQPPVNKNLLQVSADAKTVKGEKLGYMTGIMYLAPDTTSGIANTCPFATEGCRKACLFTAGRAGIFPKINQARIAKTASFKFSRPEFMEQLGKNIKALVRKAGREGYKPAVRLNGTSDLPWENVKTDEGKNIFEQFPDVQFYDYTKNPNRMDQYVKGEMPSNYHLTFSRSETNDQATVEILKNGGNAAVVFDTKKGYALPKEWNGFKVIDGDESDVRFIDGKSQVIGLRAKGKARKDTSGFVLNVEPGEKLAPKSTPSNIFSQPVDEGAPSNWGKDWRTKKSSLEQVPLKKLIPVQSDVHPVTGKTLKSEIEAANNSDEPQKISVVRQGGKLYIADGHHRAGAAILNGKTDISAWVYDLPTNKK